MYFSDNYEIKIKPQKSILISLGLYLIGFAIGMDTVMSWAISKSGTISIIRNPD